MNQFLWRLPKKTLRLKADDLGDIDISDALLARFDHYAKWCLENQSKHAFPYVLNFGEPEDEPRTPEQLQSRVIRFVPMGETVEVQIEPLKAYPASNPTLTLANLVTDHVPQGIAVINTQGEHAGDARIIYANQTLAEMMAISKSELLNARERSVFTVGKYPEDAFADYPAGGDGAKQLYDAQTTLSDISLNLLLAPNNKKPFLADFTRSVIRDVTGWCTHIVITVSDVTEKIAEETEGERLRQLNKQMQDLAGMGWWELDLETQQIFWSAGTENSTVREQQARPDLKSLIASIIPTDRVRVSDIISESIVKGVASRTEIRVMANGEKRWQRIQTQPGRVQDGKVKTVVGTSIDITDIVESEALRLKQHQELEFYLHHLDSHALLARLDGDQRIIYCNDKFGDTLRSNAQKLKNARFTELLVASGDIVEESFIDYLETLKTGDNWQGELVLFVQEGIAITLDATMSAVFDEDGNIDEIKLFGYDISARKLADEVSSRISHLNRVGSAVEDLPALVLENLIELSASQSGYLRADRIDIHLPDSVGPMQSNKQSSFQMYYKIQFEQEMPGVLMLFDRPFGYDETIRKILQPLVDLFVQLEARKRRLELDKQQEIEHKLILESLKIGSWRHDLGSRQWHFNEGLFELLDFKYVQSGLVPQSLWDQRVPIVEQLKLRESMKEMIRVDDRCEETVSITPADGSQRYIKVQGRLSRDKRGEPLSVVGIAFDVTQDVLTHQELENQKALASHQARMASIGELAAGVGHEINNPLTIIRGFLDIVDQHLASDTPNVEEVRALVEKMDDSALRIEKIVKGLRSLSHVDANVEETFSPVPILKETVGLVDEIYRRSGINLQVKFDLPPDAKLIGHEGKLQQVLMNLLSNARDAIEGQVEKTITVELQQTDNRFVMKVKDNGPGVSAEIKDKIFDPFFTTKEIGKGTGIGLSMVFSIVQEFGGRIDCLTPSTGGAEFQLSLPLATDNEYSSFSSNPLGYSAGQDSAELGRVLIVDDEEGVREFLVLMLTKFGFTVDSAVDGREALAKIKQKSKYNLIITDLTMPQMGGLEFIRQLQSEIENIDELPAVLLSTGFPDFSIDLADYPAVTGLLTKPYGLKDLRNTLHQLGFGISL